MLKIYCFSKCQVCNTVLLTTVTMLYIGIPELIHFVTENLYPLINISPFPPHIPSPAPETAILLFSMSLTYFLNLFIF